MLNSNKSVTMNMIVHDMVSGFLSVVARMYFGNSSRKHSLGVPDADQVVCADRPPHG